MLSFDGPLKLTGGGEGFYQMADTLFREYCFASVYAEGSVKFEKVAVCGNGASEGVRGKGQWVVLCVLW